MKIMNENGSVSDAIGYINVGGIVVPRAQLAAVLPDMKRFERCLEPALSLDAYMSEHEGKLPPGLSLSPTEAREIAQTLSEFGQLQRSAADHLNAELKRRSV